MKQTEVGLIPDDWEVKEFKQEATLINGRAYAQSELLKQGKYKVLRVGNFGTNDNWYYSNLELPEKQYCTQGDLLYCWSCTYGAYIWNELNTIYHYHIWKIISKGADKEYLKYILNNDTENQMKSSNGSTMAHITKGFLENRLFAFPPLAEQRRIAKALSDVDVFISTTEKLIQKKKNIKQGTMQNLLTGKKRLLGFGPQTKSPTYKQTELGPIPGFAKSTRTKMTELGEIPEDWEVMSLGEIGYFIGGGTPDTNKTEYWKGSIPWISSSDIKKNNIKDVFPTRFITKSAIENSATKICPKNTILIVSRVGVGKLAISKNEVCTSQDFSNFICEQQNVEFVAYQLLPMMQNKSSDAQGTSIKGITSDEIQNMKITLPSKEEQTAIANVLSSMDKEIETLNTKLEKYRNLKTAMMQQLLTGKIRLVK
ncbi:MAG: restriction endonuclease subunit S [Treponema sp.]|nr:restriction endonuclease subunit S [Treponema sp.]